MTQIESHHSEYHREYAPLFPNPDNLQGEELSRLLMDCYVVLEYVRCLMNALDAKKDGFIDISKSHFESLQRFADRMPAWACWEEES